jgi:hypothetical protein
MSEPSREHQRVVEKIVEMHGAEVFKFRRNVEDALDIKGELDYWGPGNPDAYLIDHETETVTVWEVGVIRPPDPKKIKRYAHLFFHLDDVYWTLKLILVDQWFHETEICLPWVMWASAAFEAEEAKQH